MSKLNPIGLILLAGTMPFTLLGLFYVVVSGEIAWQPVSLWANQFGRGDSSTTSVVAHPGGLIAAGYSSFVPPSSILQPQLPYSQFFMKQYDQTGHDVWTRTLGNSSLSRDDATYNRPGITVGTDGVYFTVVFNYTAQIRKYDLKGNILWMIPVPISNSTGLVISAGSDGVYAAGRKGLTFSSGLFVEKYDPSGVEVWSHEFGNSSSGGIKAIYAGPSRVYVVGWTDQGLPGQTKLGRRDGFIVMYDFNGNRVRTDEFGATNGVDVATGVSGDGSAVYVTGETGFYHSGFVRKYDLDGSLVRTVDFSPPQIAGSLVLSSSIAADASGTYVIANAAGRAFAARFDSSLDQVWEFTLRETFLGVSQTIAVGPNGLYIAGSSSMDLPGQHLV